MFEIECIIKSCNEPQVNKAIEAVKKQTLPFNKVTHIKNISPESKAHNIALENLECDWSLWVDGDVILDLDAHEKALYYLNKYPEYNEFGFGLRDNFIGEIICCCPVRNNALIKQFPFDDILPNDTFAAKKMKKVGWNYLRLFRKKISIGTHCDNPDDFQIFHRFYSRAVKAGNNKNFKNRNNHLRIFNKLFKKTENPLYQTAIEATKLGFNKKYYPTSHDRNFEREIYEEWKKSQ